MKRLAIVVTLLFAFAASAQIPPIVKSAFESVEKDHDAWAYTKTSVVNGKKRVETFDPSRPEAQRWQLVMKDGRTPTKEEIAAYPPEKLAKKKKNSASKSYSDFEAMIRPGSLRLVRETPSEAVYEFRLPLDADADEQERSVVDLMKGRITVAKNGSWLQALEIENEKPMKPATAVRIDRMYSKMTYRAPSNGVPALIAEERATVRGKLMMFKSLDTDSVATYSDYRKVR